MSTVPNDGDGLGGSVGHVRGGRDTNRLRCLVVSFSDIGRDARVLRQIDVLAEAYDVTVVGFGSVDDARVEMATLRDPRQSRGPLQRGLVKTVDAVRLILRRFRSAYYARPGVREAQRILADRQFDVVVANDVDALPVVCDTINGAPIVLDAHEYSPRQHDDRPLWRLLRQPEIMWICRQHLEHIDESLTVGDAIAAKWRSEFGLRPSVQRNAPPYVALRPSPVDPNLIRLIHHGGALPGRGIERLLEVAELLDERFVLHLMLLPTDRAYLTKLTARASGIPRVEILEPVKPRDVVHAIQPYDIGVYLLPPHNFNTEHALPNKFFDFIQARLAVAVGPSVEMAKVVHDRGLGIVAASCDASDLAASLAAVHPEQVAIWKRASDEAAQELCAEGESEQLKGAIERAIAQRSGAA